MLLTLPPAARQDYFPLLSEPLLMLEQLLMNLKVDWADMAVRTLKSLLVGQEAGFGSEDIDKLLAEYACKALDFSCAPRERTRSGQCSGVRGLGSRVRGPVVNHISFCTASPADRTLALTHPPLLHDYIM